MRWVILALLLALAGGPASAATGGRVIKVLPQFLDLKGRESLSPSLFDRDAYQSQLRHHPTERSGLQFKIQWKAQSAPTQDLKLRVEFRGVARGELPKTGAIDTVVRRKHWYSHWTGVKIDETTYREFGEITAWRVSLWDGGKLLSEQKSFLW